MADITYQDVQRAVQDGTRNLQADVQRMSHDISAVSSQAQLIDDLQRALQQLQTEIQRHDPRSEASMQQLVRDVQELKIRFETVERFCREMSEYFRARAAAEREDNEYRGVTP